jgi:hypothetical protein
VTACSLVLKTHHENRPVAAPCVASPWQEKAACGAGRGGNSERQGILGRGRKSADVAPLNARNPVPHAGLACAAMCLVRSMRSCS